MIAAHVEWSKNAACILPQHNKLTLCVLPKCETVFFNHKISLSGSVFLLFTGVVEVFKGHPGFGSPGVSLSPLATLAFNARTMTHSWVCQSSWYRGIESIGEVTSMVGLA